MQAGKNARNPVFWAYRARWEPGRNSSYATGKQHLYSRLTVKSNQLVTPKNC